MTTLKLKINNEPTRLPLEEGHVPHFMQPKHGTAVSIAFREAGSHEWSEKWVGCNGFITEAEAATKLETELYGQSKDAGFLAAMNEPDPIEIHDESVWAELTDDEEFKRAA